MPREVYCLQRAQHVNNVIRLLDHYFDRRHSSYILVMERLEHAQDLFDYITVREHLNIEISYHFLPQKIN